MSLPVPAHLAWLDQEDRRTAAVIRARGVLITFVSDDTACCAACRAGVPITESSAPPLGTSFAYTVGLFGIGHPELLIFGVDDSTASSVLNEVARRVRAGGDLTVGEVLEHAQWSRRTLVEYVPNPGEIVFAANRFYQRPDAASVPVLQLSWDDDHGRFPGEAGYALPAAVQPRPGTFHA